MKKVLIVGIFIFMTKWNFMLSWAEHEKSFITSVQDCMWTIAQNLGKQAQNPDRFPAQFRKTVEYKLIYIGRVMGKGVFTVHVYADGESSDQCMHLSRLIGAFIVRLHYTFETSM